MVRALRRLMALLRRDQRGITGVETAVLLTAFTVATSVLGLTYLRASFTTSDQILNQVTGLLDRSESSLFTAAPTFTDDREIKSGLDSILSRMAAPMPPIGEIDQAASQARNLEQLPGLVDQLLKSGVPVTITMLPDGGVTVTVDGVPQAVTSTQPAPGT